MAHRRMFSLSIVDTDRFLEMPSSTQALYFHLGMRADDDGFVAAPKSIAAICNCSVDDIRLLATKGFVKTFVHGSDTADHPREIGPDDDITQYL